MITGKRWLVPVLACALSLPSLAARADEPPADAPPDPNHSPFRVHIPLETGVTVGAMLVGGLPRLMLKETVRPWCGANCNPADVNPLDRTVIGHHSESAFEVSNGGFISSLALPYVFGAIDVLTSHPSDGVRGGAKDDFVLLETLSITLAANNVMSFIVRRPRPRAYDLTFSSAERAQPDNALSFYSGHTAASFAMATAYSRIYMGRHPHSPWIVPLWIGTYALAGMTGVMRTYAGDHFWTDVIVGAGAGVGFGLLIPWMHEPSTEPSRYTAWNGSPSSLHFRFAPIAFERGAGGMVVVN